MPYVGSKRKKRRTHVRTETDEEKSAPRSFIFRQGVVCEPVRELIDNLRLVMEPYTASSLKESKKNRLKDFISIAGPLGVSHMITLNQTELGTNMRFLRVPRGPTLIFKVNSYSLMRDIVSIQKHPVPRGDAFQTAPLVVLNNFGGDQVHKQLLAAMFRNMFPAINVKTVKLKQCKRVVLFNLEEIQTETGETDVIVDIRHFMVTASPVGITRKVKKIIKAKIPKLGNYEDIGDYVLGAAGGDMSSDSEAEDNEDNRVVLPQDIAGRGNLESQKSALRLKELGPRIQLKLIKIEDGLSDGQVLYHRFHSKSESEMKALEKSKQEKLRLKAERKAEQERNVKRKLEEP